jgi:hypothetical protein
MASLLHSAFASITSWITDDQFDEDGNFKFYCDSQKLIELIVEKAKEQDNTVDVEQKADDMVESPRHKHCPCPSPMKTTKVQPLHCKNENLLTEKLLRDRAESGELGIRIGDGVLCLHLITDITEGYELLLLRVDDPGQATLRRLSQIPEACSTILAICFDASKEDLDKIEDSIKGPSFSWKLDGPVSDEEEKSGKQSLTDEEFDAFVAIARATIVLHVVQAAGL